MFGLPRLLLYAIAALVAALALWWVYTAWTAKPKAEAELAKNQTQAAQASGEDAVNTVGAAGEREAASTDLTRTNDEEIRRAEGADDIVKAPVRDAGVAALCRRAAYKEDDRCRL